MAHPSMQQRERLTARAARCRRARARAVWARCVLSETQTVRPCSFRNSLVAPPSPSGILHPSIAPAGPLALHGASCTSAPTSHQGASARRTRRRLYFVPSAHTAFYFRWWYSGCRRGTRTTMKRAKMMKPRICHFSFEKVSSYASTSSISNVSSEFGMMIPWPRSPYP